MIEKSCKNCVNADGDGRPVCLDPDVTCWKCVRMSEWSPTNGLFIQGETADNEDMDRRPTPDPEDSPWGDCFTCLHEDTRAGDEPCNSCLTCGGDSPGWKPQASDKPQCEYCRHLDVMVMDPPCRECFFESDRPNWEPMQGTTEDPEQLPPPFLVDPTGKNPPIMLTPQEANPGMTGQYTFRGGIEPIDFILSNRLDFLEGSVVKYLYRYPQKGGLESLKKAKFYIERLIERWEEDHEEEAAD